MTAAAFRDEQVSSLELSQRQRSHLLLVLSQARAGREADFRHWYRRACIEAAVGAHGILSARHYEQHEVDITRGRHVRLPFQYLGIYEISVDGAEAAEGAIDFMTTLHAEQSAAESPATWLYYPASEKVGRPAAPGEGMLTIAFANGTPGQEAEFREWYATRHIRHALHIPALVSGQCFERTLFQKPGAKPAAFQTIALYEQEGSPEDILAGFASIPAGTLRFPMLDTSPLRFAESVYRPVK